MEIARQTRNSVSSTRQFTVFSDPKDTHPTKKRKYKLPPSKIETSINQTVSPTNIKKQQSAKGELYLNLLLDKQGPYSPERREAIQRYLNGPHSRTRSQTGSPATNTRSKRKVPISRDSSTNRVIKRNGASKLSARNKSATTTQRKATISIR